MQKSDQPPLTALKTSSKCSFIPYKLRFLVSFRLVMKHDPTFACGSFGSAIRTPFLPLSFCAPLLSGVAPKKIGEKLHEVNQITLRDSIVYS
uniref:Uncharacterized protein n=1 Tax=Candidatus Kentrum sp. DK TaxID=2126562 RepID=A0A450SSY8_9GAMM|nr:MAG: hypothetical protein BECKDK2373B_GA0170837_106218 [Candidatus Kentron sp. DK]